MFDTTGLTNIPAARGKAILNVDPTDKQSVPPPTKKNKKRRRKKKDGKVQKMTDERLAAYNLDPKEFRKSHKYNDLSLKYKAE